MARALDVIAVLMATAIPFILASSSSSSVGGLVQRVMFFVGYLWFAHEGYRAWKSSERRRRLAFYLQSAVRHPGYPLQRQALVRAAELPRLSPVSGWARFA